jgi:hypothetical protein
MHLVDRISQTQSRSEDFQKPFPRSNRSDDEVNQLGGLWRDTWWVWVAFLAITIVLGTTVGAFFYLLIPCLPVPFAYFAFNRYDEQGNEKADL